MRFLSVAFISFLFCCGCQPSSQRTIKFSLRVDSLINDTVSISYAVDSLKNQIRISQSDTSIINFLTDLSASWRKEGADLSAEAMRLAQLKKYDFGIINARNRIGLVAQRKSDWHAADSIYRICIREAEEKGIIKMEIRSLSYLGDLFRILSRNDSALFFLRKSANMAVRINDREEIATIYHMTGECFRNQSNYDSSLFYLQKGLIIARELQDKERISKFLGSLGSLERAQNNYAVALDYVHQSLAIAKSLRDAKTEAAALGTLGALYYDNKDYEQSLMYFNKALKMGEDMKDNIRIVYCELSIGSIHEQMKELPEAYEYYQRAFQLAKSSNYKDYTSFSLASIGEILRQQGKYNEGLEKTKEALALARESDNKEYIVSDLFYISRNYLALGNKKEALAAIQESFAIGKETGVHTNIDQAAEMLSICYDSIGDYENALRMYQLHIQLRDSISGEEQIRKFAATEFKVKEEVYKADQIKADEELKREKLVRNGFIFGSIIFAVLAVIILFNLIQNRKAKRLIEKQKLEVETQKNIVDEKQKEILDSINYARRLQSAILPPLSAIQKAFPESFVFYLPKDIVAGDFYWMQIKGDYIFIAAADCTGHGVPGAMLSVVCSNALNRAVNEFGLTDTGMILDKTTDIVLETFDQSEDTVADGMDISFLAVNNKTKTVQWSGANNPLWYFEENSDELKMIKADKQPVGKSDYRKTFNSHNLDIEKLKTIYLFTDGFADQFGGPDGKKFKQKQLQQVLIDAKNKSLIEQETVLAAAFTDWKSGIKGMEAEQVDDVTMLGLRIK
jgi:tetratricopeptide (TPR) repeat protein